MKRKPKFSFTRFAHKAFYDFHSREFIVVNDILAATTVLSILALILETSPLFSEYALIWEVIEFLAVVVFGSEYIIRLFTEPKPLRYATSFFGIIDLIAILPSLLGIGNLTALKSARALRILRFLRIIRLSKISLLATIETEHSMKDLETFGGTFRFDLTIYAFALLSAVVILGGIMFMVEGHNPQFSDIPHAMLWVLSIFTGGLPGIGVPTTDAGFALLVVTKFIGMILLGFLVSIVGKILDRALLGK